MEANPKEPPKPKPQCKLCHGAGYVMIRGGEDYGDCTRCDGTGKEK